MEYRTMYKKHKEAQNKLKTLRGIFLDFFNKTALKSNKIEQNHPQICFEKTKSDKHIHFILINQISSSYYILLD
jgi:hypothetical protein